MRLVKGTKYTLISGQEVVFESLVPESEPPQVKVSDPLDDSLTFTILVSTIKHESDQRWYGIIIP